MVLVDTSVWINHLRKTNKGLVDLLQEGLVLIHPFIVGELACGNLKNRQEILSLLQLLPMATQADHEDVMSFIDAHKLMGKGLGYIDVHLLASTLLSDAELWTFDTKLSETSFKLGVAFHDK